MASAIWRWDCFSIDVFILCKVFYFLLLWFLDFLLYLIFHALPQLANYLNDYERLSELLPHATAVACFLVRFLGNCLCACMCSLRAFCVLCDSKSGKANGAYEWLIFTHFLTSLSLPLSRFLCAANCYLYHLWFLFFFNYSANKSSSCVFWHIHTFLCTYVFIKNKLIKLLLKLLDTKLNFFDIFNFQENYLLHFLCWK